MSTLHVVDLLQKGRPAIGYSVGAGEPVSSSAAVAGLKVEGITAE